RVCGVQFSPDGRRLLVVGWSYGARLWDVATRRELWRAGQAWQTAAFSPDGRTVAISQGGGPEVIFLDATMGKERSRLRMRTKAEEDQLNSVTAIAYSPDGRWLAAALLEGDVVLLDPESGEELRRFTAVDPVKGLPWNVTLRLVGGNQINAL